MLNIIIGKNSNLSKKLSYKLKNFILISSREIFKDIEILFPYKNKEINLIFNNFQPATQLNIIENKTKYITNSILITAMILDYFQDTKINKIICTSSSSVYGNNILCNENDELKPMSLHASLKVSNEKMIEQYCRNNNIDYTIARVFNMYGGNDEFSIISKITNACLNNKEIVIVNNGNAIRDFIHIDDIVSIYLILLKIKNIKIINIGRGLGISIKSILDFLLNNGIKIAIKNIYRNELKISTADTKLLYEITKKNNFLNVEEYLKKELKL